MLKKNKETTVKVFQWLLYNINPMYRNWFFLKKNNVLFYFQLMKQAALPPYLSAMARFIYPLFCIIRFAGIYFPFTVWKITFTSYKHCLNSQTFEMIASASESVLSCTTWVSSKMLLNSLCQLYFEQIQFLNYVPLWNLPSDFFWLFK